MRGCRALACQLACVDASCSCSVWLHTASCPPVCVVQFRWSRSSAVSGYFVVTVARAACCGAGCLCALFTAPVCRLWPGALHQRGALTAAVQQPDGACGKGMFVHVQACVGHKGSDVCMQVARVMRAQEERRKKERQRQAARLNAQKTTGRPMSAKRGGRVLHCMNHVAALRNEFVKDIDTAQIDLHGTPTEKFWAHPESTSLHAAKADRMLAAVFPQKLQPLCNRLEVLQARVWIVLWCCWLWAALDSLLWMTWPV